MRRCKARSKQKGAQCGNVGKAVCERCGVCKFHGCNCANPGGRPPVHGLYRSQLRADLQDLYDLADGGTDLEPEIRLLQAKVADALRRAASDKKLWDNARFQIALTMTIAELRKLKKAKAQIDSRRESEPLADAEIPWLQPLPAGLDEGLEEAAAYLESAKHISHLEPPGGS